MWREGRPLREGSLGPPEASGPEPDQLRRTFPGNRVLARPAGSAAGGPKSLGCRRAPANGDETR
jgi:hypothetical protein